MPPTKEGNALNKGSRSKDASPLQRQRGEHSLRNGKKKRGPTPSQFDAFTPLQRVDLIFAMHAYAAISRSAH